MLYFNARSIVNKIHELHFILYSQNYYIIFITETWLTSEITDGLLDPEKKYLIIRKDRQSRGGGVCVFISCNFCVLPIVFNESFYSVEIVGFDILFKSFKMRFLLFYRPPGNSSICCTYASLLNSCLHEYCTPHFTNVVIGDANFPDINWNQCIAPDDCIQFQFLNTITELGLYQMVNQPTRGNNILDIVLTNDPSIIFDVCISAPFGSSDHNTIILSFVLDNIYSVACNDYITSLDYYALKTVGYGRLSTSYNWSNVNFDIINEKLFELDWSLIVSYNLTPDAL